MSSSAMCMIMRNCAMHDIQSMAAQYEQLSKKAKLREAEALQMSEAYTIFASMGIDPNRKDLTTLATVMVNIEIVQAFLADKNATAEALINAGVTARRKTLENAVTYIMGGPKRTARARADRRHFSRRFVASNAGAYYGNTEKIYKEVGRRWRTIERAKGDPYWEREAVHLKNLSAPAPFYL